MSVPPYDVVIATDCRLPGGTTASVAEEIAAQHAAGYRTGLLHLPSTLSALARPFAPRLQALVLDGAVDVVTAPATTRLLVVRHPVAAAQLDPTRTPAITAEQVLLIANQAAGTPDDPTAHYDPAQAHAAVARWTGLTPTWSPIGPLVRSDLTRSLGTLPITDDDWVNVIDAPAWAVPHEPVGRPVRIGRHSRDHRLKWPGTPSDLLAAYPADDPDLEVHVLGGARYAAEVLDGALPASWRVLPFGATTPRRFLAGLDVYVYQHHPDWIEAFGRSIVEAMASGVPCVLSPPFAPLFGDAAVYATPAGTRAEVLRLADDADARTALVARAQQLVADRFSHAVHVRRLTDRIGDPASGSGGTPDAAPASTAPGRAPVTAPVRRPTVLFVSSNGAGVGHLMRLMAMARRLPDEVDPIFLTHSQAVGVVADLDFPVEYLPSRKAVDAPHKRWNAMLKERLLTLLDRHDVDAVVFDGTWPYDGLMQALDERPTVRRVWSRRAMWRASLTRDVLHLSERFDLILEPGEFAADLDRGPTVPRRHETTRVGPITFLRSTEQLDRAAARAELDLPADGPVVLVQLGAGNINDTSSLQGRVVAQVREAIPEATVCLTRSAIAVSDGELPAGVHPISVYPLARVFAAFDLAVAAAGYNTFHELLLAGVPTLFLPNLETETDDQGARARWAGEHAAARCVPDPTPAALAAALHDLAPLTRAGERRPVPADDGGQQAADAIVAALAAPPSRAARREEATPAVRRPPHRELAHRALDVLPPAGRARAVAAIKKALGRPAATRQHGPVPVPPGRGFDTSTSASPTGLLLVLADGLTGDDVTHVVDEVAALQRATGAFLPLFATRSPDLGPFRRAGYAVELLPTAANVAPGEDVEVVVRDRLALLRRRWDVTATVPVDGPHDVRRRLAELVL